MPFWFFCILQRWGFSISRLAAFSSEHQTPSSESLFQPNTPHSYWVERPIFTIFSVRNVADPFNLVRREDLSGSLPRSVFFFHVIVPLGCSSSRGWLRQLGRKAKLKVWASPPLKIPVHDLSRGLLLSLPAPNKPATVLRIWALSSRSRSRKQMLPVWLREMIFFVIPT